MLFFTELGPFSAKKRTREGMDHLLSGFNLNKTERKRLEKLNKINIHVYALFAAVEYNQIEKVKTILESAVLDVNSVNSDGLTPLDIAVMMNFLPLAKILTAAGAKEGSLAHNSPDGLLAHLTQLASDAERRTGELTTRILSAAAVGSLTQPQLKEAEKQLGLWDRRQKVLKRMQNGFEQLRPPDPPPTFTVEVIGPDAVRIRFQVPEPLPECICNRLKIQWSCNESFSVLIGDKELTDWKKSELVISQLMHNMRVFFRIACGSMKGYGDFRLSEPASVIPTSWHDSDGRKSRYSGRSGALDDLAVQLRSARGASSLQTETDVTMQAAAVTDTPTNQRKNQKKMSIKQLFAGTPKFHKTFKRGVFLACILYTEGKLLMTTEEFLPVLEVDEAFPGSLNVDFHWLMKVACNWEDVKSLRQEMEKSHSSSAIHFRVKLLQAAAHMQSSLGTQDLGQLYYKPFKDDYGTVMVVTVKYVKSPKSVSSLNTKWVPLSKACTKKCLSMTSPTVGDIVASSIQSQILYHQVTSIPLGRGLYLGYLKLKSSVDLIRILVTSKMPNVLPHCKIRDNPHVSREEWEWLRERSQTPCSEMTEIEVDKDDRQICKQFERQIANAAKRLLGLLEIDMDTAHSHRLYAVEVIEMCPEVSFLILLPPQESVCSFTGQTDCLFERNDFLALSVQVFEMTHLLTYQRDLVTKYSRLSCQLETDTLVAQHLKREAFSSAEVATASRRLQQLEGFCAQVDATWRGSRWVMDVVEFARDKTNPAGGVPLLHLANALESNQADSPSFRTDHSGDFTTPPKREQFCKTSLCLKKSNTAECLVAECESSFQETSEYSKSDQQLQLGAILRLSHESNSSAGRLIVSRSENQLEARYSQMPSHRHSHQPRKASAPDAVSSPVFPRSPVASRFLRRSKQYSQSDSWIAEETATGSNGSAWPAAASNGHEEISNDRGIQRRSLAASLRSLPSTDREADSALPDGGVLQVYAAYETGLASGTSVRIHLSSNTTAREVVDLVVRQLNIATLSKGRDGPTYSVDKLKNFCLVAVVGARERCLRDDFKPLQLQNPWKKGRLFVRMKHDVLAAIEMEQNTRQLAFL